MMVITMENFGREFVRIESQNLCAVYCLVAQGKVVYVGQSTNVYARIARHLTNYRRMLAGKEPYDEGTIAPVRFDTAMVKFCAREDLSAEEFNLIQRFTPERNKLLRRSQLNLEMLPAVQEWLRKRGARQTNVGIRKRSITRASRFAA